jgi:uncharacterized GH25 family protein
MQALALILILASSVPAQERPRRVFEPVPENALRVQVVDDEGRPLPGARVAVRAMASEYEPPEQGALRLGAS